MPAALASVITSYSIHYTKLYEPQAQAPEAPAPEVQPPVQEKQGRGPQKPPEIREDLTRREGHFRVWFEKRGPAAWLSTLELQRTLERALRRAELKSYNFV